MLSVATQLQALPEQPISCAVVLAIEPCCCREYVLIYGQMKPHAHVHVCLKNETVICIGACKYNCMQI